MDFIILIVGTLLLLGIPALLIKRYEERQENLAVN